MSQAPTRIAMWSGPRNISTAMMRAWENRSDTFVSDEPFYAHYLAHTGVDHPGREAVLQNQPNDWQTVVEECISSTQANKSIHYQKHMTQHMLPHIELNWLKTVTNIFLIRSPEQVVASYSKSRPNLTAADLGFEQQARLFNHVQSHINPKPLVIESNTLLQNPKMAMTILCKHCDIPFNEDMLQWPTGKRDSDGVWAPYWYASVENSTSFSPPQKPQPIALNSNQQQVADQCSPFYELMASHVTDF